MISSGPIGADDRPCPALITVIYLWGIFLSPTPPQSKEKALLHNVLFYLSGDLSRSHPHRVIHCIQAEVLLSSYYLKNGKTLEGKHHAEVALSLTIGRGFHRIRSSRALPASQTSNFNSLPLPADTVEEGERIDAFWAVVGLNNCWSALQEFHLTFSDLQPDVVDTPWPLDLYQHDSVRTLKSPVLSFVDAFPTKHHLPRKSLLSLQEFLNGSSVAGISEKELYIKATILLARAISVHKADNGTFPGSISLRPHNLIHLSRIICPPRGGRPSRLADRNIRKQLTAHGSSRLIAFVLRRTEGPHSDARPCSHDKASSTPHSDSLRFAVQIHPGSSSDRVPDREHAHGSLVRHPCRSYARSEYRAMPSLIPYPTDARASFRSLGLVPSTCSCSM